ncbi:MAG: Cys-tRNA(Pro) deacylase, partial [Pseudomonadales bacterium]|nr:Cys-tRNA(Pro) deacylase [Pseudomonadales bacterium]
MTPAILAAEKAAVSFRVHEYVHDDGAAYGLEAAEKLGVSPARVFKTLVVLLSDSRHGIAVVPVDAQ